MDALWEPLFELACEARNRAHSPYSRFPVGAALLGDNGQVYAGCNVENLSFGLTMCAERVALGTAVAAGCKGFVRILVVADTVEPISPCGACRQVLAEFNPDLVIRSITLAGRFEDFSLAALLPRPRTGILDER